MLIPGNARWIVHDRQCGNSNCCRNRHRSSRHVSVQQSASQHNTCQQHGHAVGRYSGEGACCRFPFRSSATPAAVLANYTKVLTKQGFKAQPGDAVDGVPTKTFVRAEGQEIVTVSIVKTGDTSTVTLGATLVPASFK